MQKLSIKQLFRLLLILGEIQNQDIEECLGLSTSSVCRLMQTPSSMNIKQFERIVKLFCKRKNTMVLNVGVLSIHSWKFSTIMKLSMEAFNISLSELSQRMKMQHQTFHKRIERSSCSMHQFKETLDALDQDFIVSINGNKYLIK